MHDETDHSEHQSDARRRSGGERGVHAVTFGLGVAALAGLVATASAAAAAASAAATDTGQPAVVAAPLSEIGGTHITCSGTN